MFLGPTIEISTKGYEKILAKDLSDLPTLSTLIDKL